MPADEVKRRHDDMFTRVYDELRRLARRVKRGPANPTLNPTALVHEAFIKLATAKGFEAESQQHMVYTVVRAMKQLLLDAARRQTTLSRGGGDIRVTFDAALVQTTAFNAGDVLSVNLALDDLWQHNEPQARAFELQYFGGFQVAEIGGLMGFSEKKVQRLLRSARAHLALTLTGNPDVQGSRRHEPRTPSTC